MFAEADRNKNGRIDFEEFVEIFFKLCFYNAKWAKPMYVPSLLKL